MIPAVTAVRMTGARNRAELPLLVLGPSLGTSATALWGDCASHLADVFDVLAWDLPGHGHNRAVPDEPFSMAELATGVLRVVDDVLAGRGEVGGPFSCAGDSVGGAVGLQLLLDAPDRVTSAVLLGAGARAELDVRDRLAEIDMLVLTGRLLELDGLHLAPAEAPETVARLLREHLLGEVFAEIDGDAGGRDASTLEFTRDFAELVTQHADGSTSARPGLDRRSRTLVTLTALVARGHHEELAGHLRAARTDGLTADEIKELLLQTAIYCGVPDASTAFRVAQQILAEEEADDA